MLSSVSAYPQYEPALAELRPELLANGVVPEQRIIFCGISWNRYLTFDQALGNDRPGPRLYYLDVQSGLVVF